MMSATCVQATMPSATPDLSFRNANAADLPALIALLADDAISAARPGHTATLTPALVAAFAAIARDPNQQLLVAERAGTVVACLQLSFIPGLARGGMWRALVEAVRVALPLRATGIGAALMNEAERRARAHGCGLIQLTTDKRRHDAHRFYARLGYVASHEGMKRDL